MANANHFFNTQLKTTLSLAFCVLSQLLQEYLSFKSSPCPIMMEKADPPWLLPDQVQRYLSQAKYIFSSFQGLDGLVSKND